MLGRLGARWRGDANASLTYQNQIALKIGGHTRQRDPVGAVEDLKRFAVIAAAHHTAAIADQHQRAISQQRSTGQAEFQRAACALQLNGLLGVTKVSGAEQVAAQTIGQQRRRAGGANHPEQRALIGAFKLFPGMPFVTGAKHAASLADDE